MESNGTAEDIFSKTILVISETENAAGSVLIQKENFNKFSTHLDRITFVLKELSNLDLRSSDNLINALEILNREIKTVKRLAISCSNRSKVYLFLNCRRVVKQLEDSTKEISHALGLISLTSLDGSSVTNDMISNVCKNMSDTEYRLTTAEAQILEKIESGIEERNVDQSYASNLLHCIAEAVGIPTEQSELKREFEILESEMENDGLIEDTTEALRTEQIVALLGKANMITTPEEKERKYLRKRSSLVRQPIEPLHSFYCPISGDIMVDPVETCYGQTFERSAIEKWLADGNNLCPLTKMPLNTSRLKSNRTLRILIEEWKDRNIMITIASLKPKIESDKEQEVIDSLGKLQDLCMERELHQEWMIMEGYIPILIDRLGARNSVIRMHALDILYILAKDSDENKEKIAKVDNAIRSIVHSLSRKVKESKLALQLLMELSRNDKVRSSIGSIQGCILLLVTISSSDDAQAARDADELLDNLSSDYQNVIQMARANHFGPLLRLLSTGPDSVKMMAAKTLSEIELTDQGKLSLSKKGAQRQLLKLLSHGDIEIKEVAISALHKLSTIPQNGLELIREGAARPLFELLYCPRLSTASLRENVVATILQLAISSAASEADEIQTSIFESEEDIFKFFSLISLTGPEIQQNILQSFVAICQSSSGSTIRNTLRQISATRVLVRLCEHDNHVVGENALKLLCCLMEEGDNSSYIDHLDQTFIDALLRIARTSNNPDEIAAALGVISSLPETCEITQWLLDAGVLQVIFACLANGRSDASQRRKVVENAAGALRRFTVPTNQEWQKKIAEAGCIQVLVELLVSGTALTKQKIAISLKQFSESSGGLSKPVKKKHAAFSCFLASPESRCPVHSGICTISSSFCLLEADAVRPLVRVLAEEEEIGAREASLDALLTLIQGAQLQKGSKVLAEADAIHPMIKLLSSSSARLQEKALEALERMFRLIEFKQKYAIPAQAPLIDITQRGSSRMKSLAAKTLAHLDVIHAQSSYF